MKKIFFAPADTDNLNSSIRKDIDGNLLNHYLNSSVINEIKLKSNGYLRCFAVTKSKLGYYEQMNDEDLVLFSEKRTNKFTEVGRIIFKIHSLKLGTKLWPFVPGLPWEYIYFLKDIKKINIDKNDLVTKFGYSPKYNIQGFIPVKKESIELFENAFGSIEDFLNIDINLLINDENDKLIDAIEQAEPIQVPIKPIKRGEAKIVSGKKEWERNLRISKKAIIDASFRCEIDENHISFTSDNTNQNFVEAHHLIPMSSQYDFEYSLDVPANIISLCPNCHRKLHHAKYSEKVPLLKSLLEERINSLNNFKIPIDFDKLKSYYNGK